MLTLKTKQLKDALTKSLNGKGVYEDVMLRAWAGGNALEIVSADNDCFLSLFIDVADIPVDMVAVVNRKAVLNTLKSIKDDAINLVLQEGDDADYLVIKTEKANYRFKVASNRIFEAYDPNILKTKGKVFLDGGAVAKAIEKVIYALSKDKYDYETYRGVGFIFDEANKLIIAGTDGHRLDACYLDIENSEITGRYSIPKTSAMYLKKLLKGVVAFDIIETDKFTRMAIFRGSDFVFSSYFAGDGYPNVISVINSWKSKIKVELKLSKDAIVDVLKSFIIDKKDYNPIKLTLTTGNLNILSIKDNSTVDIAVDYTGDDYVIGFNALYLLEAIDNACNNEVIIKLPEAVDYPAYIEAPDNCNCLAMVMPMLIPSDNNKV